MALGKNAAITAGFIAAFGLGVWTGPHLVNRTAPDVAAAGNVAPDAPASPLTTDLKAAPRTKTVARAVYRPAEFAPIKASVPVGAPALHDRLKPLMNKGADMGIAADGFKSAEQFATVVHASQNTDVPFMLLKHRVLNEGDTLVAAIRKSKPEIDAIVEADRARAEARSDLTSLD